MLWNYKLSSINLSLHEIRYKLFVDPDTKVSCNISLITSHTYLDKFGISTFFHCNGLLLCTTKDNRLVILNPCTSQTKWIETSSPLNKNTCVTLGCVNNNSFHNYKILRLDKKFSVINNSIVYDLEIYEFSSNSWRVIDEITFKFFLRSKCISLMGNIYWLASSKARATYEFVLVFDFTKDKFTRLNLPHQHFTHSIKRLSTINEDKLMFLHTNSWETTKIEIWVSTMNESWRKFLVISSFEEYLIWNSLFVDEENKFVVCCMFKGRNGIAYIQREDGKYIKIPFEEEPTFETPFNFVPFTDMFVPITGNYVPSLVQI